MRRRLFSQVSRNDRHQFFAGEVFPSQLLHVGRRHGLYAADVLVDDGMVAAAEDVLDRNVGNAELTSTAQSSTCSVRSISAEKSTWPGVSSSVTRMSYLSDGSNLLDIPMEQLGGDNEVRVLIGPENVAEELRDSSVVLATYDAGENMRGLIGVVGPTRMDYSKVAAKLSFIAAGLSKLLGGGTLPPPGLDNKLIIKGDDTDEHENERPEADGAGNGSGR